MSDFILFDSVEIKDHIISAEIIEAVCCSHQCPARIYLTTNPNSCVRARTSFDIIKKLPPLINPAKWMKVEDDKTRNIIAISRISQIKRFQASSEEWTSIHLISGVRVETTEPWQSVIAKLPHLSVHSVC